MSEAKVDNPAPTDSLEQQLEVLLNKMQTDLNEAGEQIASEPTPAANSAPEMVTEESINQILEAELNAQTAATVEASKTASETEPAAELPEAVDAVAVESLPATIETESVVAQATTADFATSSEEVTASLDSAVSEMMADASKSLAASEHAAVAKSAAPVQALASPGPALASPEPAPASPEPVPVAQTPSASTDSAAPTVQASSVEDLDSQLASLTEQLLSEPDTGVGALAVAAVHAPVASNRSADSGQAAHSNPTSKPPEVKVTAEKSTSTASEKIAAAAASLKLPPIQISGLSALLVRVLSPLSAPLNRYPKVVRDTLGWVSLITLFWAMTIWAYLLFFHKPVDAEIPKSAPHIAGDVSKAGHDEHGKSGNDHDVHGGHENGAKSDKDHSDGASGHEAETSAGHGEPAKKSHAAADSHAETAKGDVPHKSPQENGGH